MQTIVASTMSENEVAILFSYSGATKDTIHVAETVKKPEQKSSVLLALSSLL